jgi:hypothetical protein
MFKIGVSVCQNKHLKTKFISGHVRVRFRGKFYFGSHLLYIIVHTIHTVYVLLFTHIWSQIMINSNFYAKIKNL